MLHKTFYVQHWNSTLIPLLVKNLILSSLHVGPFQLIRYQRRCGLACSTGSSCFSIDPFYKWFLGLKYIKSSFPSNLIPMIKSGYNVAHATTAKLSWHVQNCDLIGVIIIVWVTHIFTIFRLWDHKLFVCFSSLFQNSIFATKRVVFPIIISYYYQNSILFTQVCLFVLQDIFSCL